MAKHKRERRPLSDSGTRFRDAVGRYLRAKGWSVVVAGPVGLVSYAGNRHQLTIDFLGTQKAKKSETEE
jgi:hypothetical protein